MTGGGGENQRGRRQSFGRDAALPQVRSETGLTDAAFVMNGTYERMLIFAQSLSDAQLSRNSQQIHTSFKLNNLFI